MGENLYLNISGYLVITAIAGELWPDINAKDDIEVFQTNVVQTGFAEVLNEELYSFEYQFGGCD